MPCNYPVRAFRIADKLGRPDGVSFAPTKGMNITHDITVPCGQCTGCKVERARQWSIRCMHEAALHQHNCFITLTYDDEHLPDNNDLDYPAFQLFMKRLRKKAGKKIRFYMSGEYGEKKERPHYHACIFGYDFPDKVLFKKSAKGIEVYTSKILDSLWGLGFTTVCPMTQEAAQYTASYIMKKQGGWRSKSDYEIIDRETGEISYRTKEFAKMSLKPGIGSSWYEKYKKEVFPFDRVIVKGREMKPPRYYTKKLKEEDAEAYEELLEKRYAYAMEHKEDLTENRLLDRETVLKAKLNFRKRKSI